MSRKIKDIPISPLLENATDNNVGELISREQAIEAIEHITTSMSICVNSDECHGMKRMQRQAVIELANMPTIQPDNELQKLADEIARFKRCVKSENSDYLTGYLSALSVVEGMIADMREVTT